MSMLIVIVAVVVVATFCIVRAVAGSLVNKQNPQAKNDASFWGGTGTGDGSCDAGSSDGGSGGDG